MYFIGSNGINWITEDFGKKIKAINTGIIMENYLIHPSEPTWGLFSTVDSKININSDNNNNNTINTTNITNTINSVNRKVYYTSDYGMTYKLLVSHVFQYEW